MKRKCFCGLISFVIILLILTSITSYAGPKAKQSVKDSLVFDPSVCTSETYTTTEGQTIKYRACLNIIYVSKPIYVSTPPDGMSLPYTYHIMNFYYPEEYDNGGSINGYTSQTAPIFFRMTVGGYRQGAPATILTKSIQQALLRGYVIASPGARGWNTLDESGLYYVGKAPASIVDMKAAIRYLRHNDKIMPGDANKIITSGSSASGALSALLGATGNNEDYEPYLKAIGAADERDDIFAASCYCPITNLDNSDMAYEWQFNGSTKWEPFCPPLCPTPESLTPEEIEVSNELKAMFPAYLNSLRLIKYEPRNDKGVGLENAPGQIKKGTLLTLDENGEGNFKDYVASFIIESAQKALDEGQDLSGFPYLTIEDGIVKDINFWAFSDTRMKKPPAFDSLTLGTFENHLFGTANVDMQHFTQYGYENSWVGGSLADPKIVKMMNPMYYIGAKKTDIAKYWRIRHGTRDRHTSLAIPVILATMLANQGYNVDFALPWNIGHGGEYDLEELFDWIDMISKPKQH